MLNELSHVVSALERVGIVTASRHPRINPMGKNRELLIVRLTDQAKAAEVQFVSGDKAASLFRVEHGAAGSSFPGFNLPTPLLNLMPILRDELKPALEKLSGLWKRANSPLTEILECVSSLATSAPDREFTPSQCKQFERSVIDLVEELQALCGQAPADLKNFTRLLDVVGHAELTLPQFSREVTGALLQAAATADRETLGLIQVVLFGVLDWKKRDAEFGSVDYWAQKARQDKNANQPVYLDLAASDHLHKPVAHPQTSEALNSLCPQKSVGLTGQAAFWNRRQTISGKAGTAMSWRILTGTFSNEA